MVLNFASWSPGGTLMQWLGGAAAMQMMFVIGLTIGWASPYLAKFASENQPFPATVDEVSWMASVFHLGRPPGAILGAICIQYFGNKTAMICNGCALLISWILIILANSPSFIYGALIIHGASCEIAFLSFPLYLGDISSPKIRGALITMAGNGLIVGIVVGNAMGPYISMKLYAGISLVPNICFLFFFFWVPHSPYHLVSKGKINDAERSIVRYNPKADTVAEMENIQRIVTDAKSITLIDRLREYIIPRNRKIAMIITMLYIFTLLSGTDPVEAYMQTILSRGMVTVIAPSTVPVIANILGFVAGSVTMYLTEKLGRRIMWIVSSAGICGTMIALGTHFHLLATGFDAATFQWLPIFAMLSFKVFYNVGFANIPPILVGELLSPNIRTIATCVTSISVALSAFALINVYQSLIQVINEAYVYWMYAIVTLGSAVFGFLLVPEMKGKTLAEIQDILSKNEN